MKKVSFLLTIFSMLVSCVSNINSNPNSQIIESAILWIAPVDSTFVSPEFRKLSENNSLFQRKGNFYKAKSELYAFEHEVIYIGLKGINNIAGPNVFLLGEPGDVAKAITKKYGYEFKSKEKLISKLQKNVYLIIKKHPGNDELTMVIGRYIGR